MKTKSVTETCGPMTKEHDYLGHFGKDENITKGHNTNTIRDDVVPQRNMQDNPDPSRRFDTSIPNAYRGKLQPDFESGNSLPENVNPNRKIRI